MKRPAGLSTTDRHSRQRLEENHLTENVATEKNIRSVNTREKINAVPPLPQIEDCQYDLLKKLRLLTNSINEIDDSGTEQDTDSRPNGNPPDNVSTDSTAEQLFGDRSERLSVASSRNSRRLINDTEIFDLMQTIDYRLLVMKGQITPNIRNAVKKRRLKLSMGQRHLAIALHVSSQTVCNWENGACKRCSKTHRILLDKFLSGQLDKTCANYRYSASFMKLRTLNRILHKVFFIAQQAMTAGRFQKGENSVFLKAMVDLVQTRVERLL